MYQENAFVEILFSHLKILFLLLYKIKQYYVKVGSQATGN